jgi:ethanolamine utilization protein EutN
MNLARVVGNVVSSDCHPAYNARKLMLAQILDCNLKPTGAVYMAIDYVQAGPGDLVLLGSAPGLASQVFKLKNAPIDHMIMGIVDRVSLRPSDGGEAA